MHTCILFALFSAWATGLAFDKFPVYYYWGPHPPPKKKKKICASSWWWLFPLDFGKMFDNSFPTCVFFFFKVEISSRILIPLFRPGSVHSGLSSWDEHDGVFPDEKCVSSFPDRFPYYAWTAALSAHSDFVGSKVYACLGVVCHLHFWQNDRGLLHATAVTQGWNGHRRKS